MCCVSAVCRKVVHRDIAVRNFLVNCDGRVLICDFGLTEFLPEGQDYLRAFCLFMYFLLHCMCESNTQKPASGAPLADVTQRTRSKHKLPTARGYFRTRQIRSRSRFNLFRNRCSWSWTPKTRRGVHRSELMSENLIRNMVVSSIMR